MTGTLLTTVEVAERLGLSSAAVAQAVRSGALQPTARTNDDFLFTERAVAAFAERRAQLAASPLQPPAAGSRSEWSGDVDRLNLWLKELTDVLPASGGQAAFQAPPPSVPVVEAPVVDFRPPAPVAKPETPPPPPPAAEPPPAPAAEKHQPVDPPPAAEPELAVAAVEPAPQAPAPIAARSLLERIAAAEPVDSLSPAEPISATPLPEPALRVREADPVAPLAAAPPPAQAPSPVVDPVPAAVAEVAAPPSSAGPDLSRQAVLVVQPIVRFRVLRDVTDRLAAVRGIADARLERLEGGVASYRVSFEGERPSGDAIGEALAALNLEVILVDSLL